MIPKNYVIGDLPVSTRAEAMAANAPRYFTGIACKHGHVDYRRTIGGDCLQCQRDAAAKKRVAIKSNPAALEKRRAAQLAYAMRRLSDPETRERVRELESLAYHRSASRKRKKAEADARRNARVETQNRRRQIVMARYYRLQETNPPAFSRMRDQRKIMLRFATPHWVGLFYSTQIRDIYWSAARKTRETGIKHHVDHIVPINHEAVCGLHVPWNLQVVTASENIRKSNTFDPLLGVVAPTQSTLS